MRGIQYAANSRSITEAEEYWIIRWRLWSGRAPTWPLMMTPTLRQWLSFRQTAG
jgi:hypothetical protein